MTDFVEPVTVLRTRGHRINDKEVRVVHENAGRFRKEHIRVDESPNPAGRMFGEESQRVVVGVACEILKLRDTLIVKEDCVGSVDLQCCGKPEHEPAYEKPKQEEGRP